MHPFRLKRSLLAAVLLAPAVLAAQDYPPEPQDYPPDVARGKVVYRRHCLSCHGTGGWGDGPSAPLLRIAPANFHRFSSLLKSDEELLRTIEHGVVYSPMHAWRGQLSDGEMRDVVAYIRVLSRQSR